MHARSVAGRRPLPVALVVAAALLAAVAWLRPVVAQDTTPLATPAARGSADCTEPLGLPAGNACVTVVHASPDAPAVDVYLDGQLAVPGLAFGSTSGYVAVPAGDHRVQVAPAGAPIDQAVIDETLPFEAGDAYEVAAIGPLGAIEAALYRANLDPLAGDTARVRVIQAIPEAPPADVALAGGEVLFSNVAFNVGVPEYVEVPVGATPVDLVVRPAGQDTPILNIPGATLQPGLVYTFYPIGTVSDPSTLRVLPVVAPSAGSAAVGTPVAATPIPIVPATPTS